MAVSSATSTPRSTATRAQPSRSSSSYKQAPSTKKAAESPRNSLQNGHMGESVSHMQQELNKAGANLDVDGKFGPKTEAAVRDYQRQNGLTIDGKAGVQTLGKLFSDGHGTDTYTGKTAGATPAAPTAAQQAARPAGTAKAGAVQRPMNPKGARAKPPAITSPSANPQRNGTAATQTPENDRHVVDRAAAAQQATQGVRPKAGLQEPKATAAKPADRVAAPRAKAGQPPNKTASFDKVSKTGQRNQMVTGRITVNGKTYDFRSGGYGRGNLPAGEYKVTPHLYSRGDASMSKTDAKGKVGYSYALSNKYDARVGGTRSLLRIHPDGRGPGTMGCIGIVGNAEVQRQFRADMQAELARNSGSFNLRVG